MDLAHGKQKAQWKDELQIHGGKLGRNVCLFESSQELQTPETLMHHDIVLTTYWEVSNSWPRTEKNLSLALEKQGIDDRMSQHQSWANKNKKARGKLHRVKWYRVRLSFPL